MKRDARRVYLELAKEIHAPMCLICKHPYWESEGCCEGYPCCEHPLRAIQEREEDYPLEDGQDCWGFYPRYAVSTCADIVGVVLSQNYLDWAMRSYSRTTVTVYGKTGRADGFKESKVRIGHDGLKEWEE